MKKFLGKMKVAALLAAVLMIAVSALQAGQRPPGGGHFRVAEPASIVLLGAGLVSLAIYAKRKNGKKR